METKASASHFNPLHVAATVILSSMLFAGCDANIQPMTPVGNPPSAGGHQSAEMHAFSALAQTSASRRAATWPASGPSSMSADAAKTDLLYVSDTETSEVYVFSYPAGKLKGTLTGFNQPQGLCTDKTGDVWISNSEASNVIEYAHGGKKPIATLQAPGELPVGCAVDPTSGNLAVSNFLTTQGATGSVAIYKHASGVPKTYVVPSFYEVFFLGYDNQGNLYVDGVNAQDAFQFAKLAKGSRAFKSVTLNQTIAFPGGVQADGKNVAVGDQRNASVPSVIYRFTITGSAGKEVSATTLLASSAVVQFYIEGGRVIGPNSGGHDTGFWNYPAGGSPTKVLIGGQDEPIGSVVSTIAG